MNAHLARPTLLLATLASVVALLVYQPAPAFGAAGTWSAVTSGNWSDTANWTSGTVANGATFLATIGTNITAGATITIGLVLGIDAPSWVSNPARR